MVLCFGHFGTVRDEDRPDFDTSTVNGGLDMDPQTSATLVVSRAEFAELGRGVCLIPSGSQ